MPGQVDEELKWRLVRGIDKGKLREARLQAHYAAQWLARAARAYIAPQPDDGHTSLNLVASIDGFTTQAWQNGLQLSLQLRTLTLALHEGDVATPVSSFALSGHSDAQARQWLGERLVQRNLDAWALDAMPPYEMPAHRIAEGARYDAAACAEALAELAAWFANAHGLLGQIQRRLLGQKLAASPLCCWPHHFDLATLTTLPKQAAEETGYVGIGLSPGDNYYDEPYFYVSVYPKPDPSMLPTLPMFGHWHTHEFMAAIVPAHKIIAAKDQEAETGEFLGHAVDAALKLLNASGRAL
jgi:hypothetical protein